jgi:hypothetical protein
MQKQVFSNAAFEFALNNVEQIVSQFENVTADAAGRGPSITLEVDELRTTPTTFDGDQAPKAFLGSFAHSVQAGLDCAHNRALFRAS